MYIYIYIYKKIIYTRKNREKTQINTNEKAQINTLHVFSSQETGIPKYTKRKMQALHRKRQRKGTYQHEKKAKIDRNEKAQTNTKEQAKMSIEADLKAALRAPLVRRAEGPIDCRNPKLAIALLSCRRSRSTCATCARRLPG